MYEKIFILFEIDLSQIFPMQPSEIQISVWIESYDEKTAENYRNCYIAEKHIVYKLFKISIPNFKSKNLKI